MSGTMTFQGAMCFASEEERDRAVAALASAEDSLLSKANGLVVRHRAVLVHLKITAPSRMYSATHMALWRACAKAIAASVECTFEGDEPEHVVARPPPALPVPTQSAARRESSRPARDGASDVLVLYALADDSEEPNEASRSFVAGVVDPEHFRAYPAPDGIELPAVELAVKLNELLAGEGLARDERAVFEDALEWLQATAAPLYVARLEPASLPDRGA